MSNQIFSDYNQIDFSTPAGRKEIFRAVRYFASGERAKAEAKKLQAAMQAFGNSGDFPASVLPILEKFHATPSYDTGFEDIFDIKDFTTIPRNGFQILDVEDGLAFRKIPVGGSVEIYKMGGTAVTVNFDRYGGGLGWDRSLIDDEEYWTLEDNAVAFVNKAAADKAAAYYALIEALSSTYDVAWQAADPSGLAATDATYTANRDAQTLNAAALAILTAIKDKGYGVTPGNAQFVVLTPLELVGRLNKALGLLLQGFAGSTNQAAFRFRLIPTTMLGATNKYYVCIPKIKAKGGNRKNLTIYNRFDEEKYEDIAVGWMRYGGAIGDQTQFRRCSIS